MAKRAAPPPRRAPKAEPAPVAAESSGPDLAFLDELDVAGLTAIIDRAETLRTNKVAAEKAAVIQRMKADMASYGLRQEDLFGGSSRKAASSSGAKRASPAPKYRGPDGAEWSGRGRTPTWLTALEAEGKKRDEFLIDKG